MTIFVPFDGSELAEAALVRATEFANALDETVLAVSVIPKNGVEYARERGWIEPDEAFDLESIVSELHRQVADLAPSADFHHEVVDRFVSQGMVGRRLRRLAREEDASMVVIGSENAGRITTPLSVGRAVTTGDAYDVVIVRDRSPAKIEKLRKSSPHRQSRSDFYLPE